MKKLFTLKLKKTQIELAEDKKIQELEKRIEKMAAQQELLSSRIEALIQIVSSSLSEKREPVRECSCGAPLRKVLGTWPHLQSFWECDSCGNTVVPF